MGAITIRRSTDTVVAESVDRSGAHGDDHLLELWLAGKSTHTVRAYRADTETFLEFIAARGKALEAVTLSDLLEYVDALRGATATRARRVGAIKSLMSFGHRTGYLRFNLGRAVKTPKIRNQLAERILSEEEVHRMLGATKGRDATLIRMLYVAGLRVSEAVALRWEHVHPRNGGAVLTVHGKGEKTRHVLITARLATELTDLRGGALEDAPVFATRTGHKVHASNVAKTVRRAARGAGIDRPVSPHWLRHAHASHALDRGAPVHLVQATLGHASVATTGRYLHARPGDGSARYLAA